MTTENSKNEEVWENTNNSYNNDSYLSKNINNFLKEKGYDNNDDPIIKDCHSNPDGFFTDNNNCIKRSKNHIFMADEISNNCNLISCENSINCDSIQNIGLDFCDITSTKRFNANRETMKDFNNTPFEHSITPVQGSKDCSPILPGLNKDCYDNPGKNSKEHCINPDENSNAHHITPGEKSKECSINPDENSKVHSITPGEKSKERSNTPYEKSKEHSINPDEKSKECSIKPDEKSKERSINPDEKSKECGINPYEKSKEHIITTGEKSKVHSITTGEKSNEHSNGEKSIDYTNISGLKSKDCSPSLPGLATITSDYSR